MVSKVNVTHHEVPDRSYHWECDVSDNESSWLIRIVLEEQGKQSHEIVCGSNGDLVATIFTHTGPGSELVSDPTFRTQATVEFGVLPPESALELHPIWLIYCSPKWFEQTQANELPPLVGFGEGQTNLIRKVNFEIERTLDQASGVHTEFTFWNPGYSWYHLDGMLYVTKTSKEASRELYAQLQLRSDVQPERANRLFRYTRFRSGVNAFNTWDIIESNREKIERMDFLPVPDRSMRVKDRRWANHDPAVWEVSYIETTPRSQWRSIEDPSLIRNYEAAAQIPPGSHSQASISKRLMLIGVLLAIGGVGIGATFFQRRN